MQEGWLCPRCKRINAPWISQCLCKDTQQYWTTNVTTLKDVLNEKVKDSNQIC